MQRVVVVGSGGAGKSTLARRLAAVTGLPLHHLDVLFWGPNWQETPSEEWERVQRRLVSGERWIIDGNYAATLDIRIAAADTIVFLDLPRVLCTRRATLRSLRRWGQRRPDLAEGCNERFDLEFLRWVWDFNRTTRPNVVDAITRHGEGKRIVWLKRPSDVRNFLASPHDHPTAVPS